MPVSQIPISKGVFRTQDGRSLQNNEFAEEFVNLLIDNAGGNFDRPTLASFTTLDSTDIIGATWFANRIVCVTADRKLYAVETDGTITDITSVVLPGSDRPTFATDKSVLIIAGGGEPLKWQGVGSVTQLLGGSPPKFSHVVYLDGYIIGNKRNASEKNKVVQFSNLDDPETWTATDFFSAEGDPDEVQGLATSQRELYVVGENTIEIWQNIGSSPIPFARSFVWQYGTPAPYSITAADNSIFILDQNRRILQFSGRSLARVSEGIERALESYSTVSDCWSASFRYKGSVHVLFNFPTAGKTWSIDLKNQQWTEWRGFDSGWARLRMNSLVYVPSLDTTYAGDYNSGSLYQFSDTTKTDAGGIFKRSRRFSFRNLGASVRKRSNWLRFNLNRDVASYSGTTSQTNPQVELRYNDDGKGWVDFKPRDMGLKGELKHHIEWRRLGQYRNRQYEYQISDPVEFSLAGIDTDEEAMVS